MRAESRDHLVVVSGCSGSGRSSLLAELERRGYAIVEEPGPRVIAQERARRGNAFPWTDMTAFAVRALDLAQTDHAWAEQASGTIFFDRGLVDAASALEHATGQPLLSALPGQHYNARVFMTPPWPEIYLSGADQRHDLAAAEAEYARLTEAYDRLGYTVTVVPRTGIAARADFVLAALPALARGNARALSAV